jgi:hypothetical protein
MLWKEKILRVAKGCVSWITPIFLPSKHRWALVATWMGDLLGKSRVVGAFSFNFQNILVKCKNCTVDYVTFSFRITSEY